MFVLKKKSYSHIPNHVFIKLLELLQKIKNKNLFKQLLENMVQSLDMNKPITQFFFSISN